MATQKRKHNTAAQRAHQKNVERRKVQEKAEKRRAFLQKYRKHLTIGIPALIVLIVGIWLICKATIGPGGSIPNFFGSLQGVQDNWIVTNQGSSSSPRYYKMGTFDVPEGYTLDPDYNISSDQLARNFFCRADEETAPVVSAYVSGVTGRSAAEMAETVAGYGIYEETPAVQKGTISGHDAVWVTGLSNDDEEAYSNADEETGELPELEIGHRQMTLYVDSVQGGCVLVFMQSAAGTQAAEIPSEEDFMAGVETILAGLTVEK